MHIDKIKARNMSLKKDDLMKNPEGFYFVAKGTTKRFMVCGKGSDGTKMCKILSEADKQDLESQGLKFVPMAKKAKKSKKGSGSKKSKKSKKSKRSKKSDC